LVHVEVVVLKKLMGSGPFDLYKKKRQRKSGGTKNVFLIHINSGMSYESAELKEVNKMLDQFDTEPKGSNLRERTFLKRAEAERAWVYLTLRWS
jgi:hypothetical protein